MIAKEKRKVRLEARRSKFNTSQRVTCLWVSDFNKFRIIIGFTDYKCLTDFLLKVNQNHQN